MKTLLKPIHSLSRFLHDSPDVTLGNAIFGSTHALFNSQLQEEANNFMVSVPVPGMNKKDLNVHIERQLLVISAKEQAGLTNLTSASKCRVLHSFVLPDGVDTNRIQAKCRHGLLTVHIEKMKSKKRPIVIKVGDNDNERRHTMRLRGWWERTKEKMAFGKFSFNARMMKTSGN